VLPVIELRQYALKPGQRDVLIDLFDRHFIEAQESVGMTIIGQFRDQQRQDRFVWMRGFADMSTRHNALEQFYNGPVWAAHKAAANDTMLDSDDVLLLKPARSGRVFTFEQPRPGADRPRCVLAGIYTLAEPADDALLSAFERKISPQLVARGLNLETLLVTESAPNTFARLPVREDARVLVWLGTIERELSSKEIDDIRAVSALDGTKGLSLLHLEPTSRSRLGAGPHAARATKHDFDFLHGAWDVHSRYLKKRLKRSTEWIEFDARSDVEPLLNGFGQLERFSAVRDGLPVDGITLRLFNPDTGEWSLHWADTARARVLLPPMVGRFKGDVGEFLGDETVDGKRVLCRFYWTRTADGSPHWEQAFSDDGGKTWETNWTMTFRRRSEE
jgi:hypothetical protein